MSLLQQQSRRSPPTQALFASFAKSSLDSIAIAVHRHLIKHNPVLSTTPVPTSDTPPKALWDSQGWCILEAGLQVGREDPVNGSLRRINQKYLSKTQPYEAPKVMY
jgi:hypothetical protein